VKRWSQGIVSLGVGAGLGLGALVAARPWVPTGPITEGVRVEGHEVDAGAELYRALDALEADMRARSITLRFPGANQVVTLGELSVRVDREATVRALRAVGHRGDLGVRLREARAARRGAVDVPAVYVADREAAMARIERLAAAFDRPPVDASIDLDRHERTPDVVGRSLDAGATVDAVIAALDGLATGREDGVDLVSVPKRAAVTLDDIDDVDVTKVLGAFETKYAVYKVGRAKNVELAAKRMDGLLVPPGGEVSFNERVGPRTREAGFHEAPEILGDELTTGIGGGTCQVSSTLFAAVLHGGLAVVSRRNHSRPSDYTALGLDATVKYPQVDFRFRNDYPFPILVHAFTPKPGVLRVELLGGETVERVDYHFAVSRVEPYLRRITEKVFLPAGKSVMKQKGTRGMDVHSTMVLRFKDGRVETRTFFSGYRATPEVFWVAPGFDREELPPLPEHAKGVEGEPLEDDDDDTYSG
jgi:vancomycin resistance protein YoaR